MKEKFSLIHTGGPYGDEMSTYDGHLNQSLTVYQFINAMLEQHPDEWGYVRIFNHSYTEYLEYSSKSKIMFISSQFDSCLNKKIKSFTARGGWTRMDYSLVLED